MIAEDPGRPRGRVLLDADGRTIARFSENVLGAVLVNATEGEPPTGGPWISQFFRHPDARGIGAPLLRRALAIATRDGLPVLGLAVTHGNTAIALYEAHGFAEVLDSLTIEL